MKSEKKNYLHRRTPNKQKKKREIFFEFSFNATTNYARKKLQLNFFGSSKVFQTHKKKMRNKTNMDYTMKKDEHRQLE